VKRDTLLAVALALLAVVALGVAAATLDSAVSLGGGGFGGGVEGDTPSAGDGPGDPGFSPSPGGDFALATQPLCYYEFLREPPALLVLFGSLVGIAAIVYRDTRSALPALAAAGAVGFPIGLIWWGLATCGSVSDESEFELGIAGSDEGSFPRAAAGGTGPGGRGAASAPELLFALVVAALVASVGVLLLAGGDDEATPGSGAAAENDPDEPEPDSPPSGVPPGKRPIGSSRRTPTTRCTGRGAT